MVSKKLEIDLNTLDMLAYTILTNDTNTNKSTAKQMIKLIQEIKSRGL